MWALAILVLAGAAVYALLTPSLWFNVYVAGVLTLGALGVNHLRMRKRNSAFKPLKTLLLADGVLLAGIVALLFERVLDPSLWLEGSIGIYLVMVLVFVLLPLTAIVGGANAIVSWRGKRRRQ